MLGLPPQARQEATGTTHELVCRVTIPGDPVPWQRAHSRGRQRYTPARMRAHQQLLAWEVKRRLPRGWKPDRSPYYLAVWFYCGPRSRGDRSNYLKQVEDALQGVIWLNDRQVVAGPASRFDRQDNPRTEIQVYRIVTPHREV